MTERQGGSICKSNGKRYSGATNTLARTCGESIYRFGNPQLAHKIGQGAANVKRYSKEVIHHPLNMASVCSLRCNDAMNIGQKTKQADALAEKNKAGNQQITLYNLAIVCIIELRSK